MGTKRDDFLTFVAHLPILVKRRLMGDINSLSIPKPETMEEKIGGEILEQRASTKMISGIQLTKKIGGGNFGG